MKKLIFGLFGIIIGLCIGTFMKNYQTLEIVSMCNSMLNMRQKSPFEIIGLNQNDTPNNSQKNLVFVGVMTAQNFLKDRAKAVYDTWGKNVPGKIAFFSSEDSYSDELPLVALRGVDDRYPPQKKSFMMLHYMYEHFIDKFEWFARTDDDVYIRPDKLEKFLRSVDSSKAQFIGQAGRGNNEEFGLLSLEFDENFCMGGPGVIFSRETLRRVAPHIRTCLKNLYSTHEDVEIGRCVQKYAGTPCTWNYEMQSIFHHNSSGSRAFSGNLKNKEVHSAISLHPVKKAPFMYRLHSYVIGLKAQEYRQESLYLHRDITQMLDLLQIPKTTKILSPGVPIYPDNENKNNYLGDPDILGINPDLNRFKPLHTEDIVEWDFIAKSIYSAVHANPKRKVESSLKEGLEDVIREVMENINNFSRQRGRIIEFRELLYGYTRVNPIHGHDLVLDLLLVYKKYRGKKMTVPVRRHLYIQRSFTDLSIREIISSDTNRNLRKNYSDFYISQSNKLSKISDKMKYIFNTGLEKISDTLAITGLDKFTPSGSAAGSVSLASVFLGDRIVFILPLFGRYEVFLRFLSNYESVILKSRKDPNVNLLIALFTDQNETPLILSSLELIRNKYQGADGINIIQLNGNFSRGLALDTAIRSNYVEMNDILFFIDVDIIFNMLTLERIRRNTVKNEQIYFPIVFSEYKNREEGQENNQINISNYTITNSNGYFRQFGYGLVCIYQADILNTNINGFNTDIQGWGLEDVKFIDKIIISNLKQNQKLLNIADGNSVNNNFDFIINNKELAIFRSPDPTLIHIYHPIICDKNLDEAQYKMCFGSKANTLSNFKFIENIFMNNRIIIDNLKKNKVEDNL